MSAAAKKPATNPGKPRLDADSTAMIYAGLNITQLAALFKMEPKTVTAKLTQGEVKPCGQRNLTDIFYVHEAAPFLVKPAYDIEAYIRRMNHNDLPKHLTKEFWAGLKSRQDYEERAGMLWRTEKIIQHVGELFKLVKMSALLMIDAVERTTELSDKQRDLVKSLTHGMLEEITQRIEAEFKMPDDDTVRRVRDEMSQEASDERQKAEDEEEL